MLGTKMVKDVYGVSGANFGVGAEVLGRAALEDEFAMASGQHFDKDTGRFASPHPHALDRRRSRETVSAIEMILAGS
jgi:hypothetical protein